jgi:hypothetical protein
MYVLLQLIRDQLAVLLSYLLLLQELPLELAKVCQLDLFLLMFLGLLIVSDFSGNELLFELLL